MAKKKKQKGPRDYLGEVFSGEGSKRATSGKVTAPYSKRSEALMGGLLGGPYAPIPRIIRHHSESQYTPAERAARRGTVGSRVSDTAKQYLGYGIPAGIGHVGGKHMLSKGKTGLAIGLMGGGIAAGAGGFALARKHVNKLRNKRLVAAGGKLKGKAYHPVRHT